MQRPSLYAGIFGPQSCGGVVVDGVPTRPDRKSKGAGREHVRKTVHGRTQHGFTLVQGGSYVSEKCLLSLGGVPWDGSSASSLVLRRSEFSPSIPPRFVAFAWRYRPNSAEGNDETSRFLNNPGNASMSSSSLPVAVGWGERGPRSLRELLVLC
jgi:hypothetical protein